MPVLLIGAMSGSRLLYRAWKERTLLGMVRHPGAAPVLVLGAGTAAASLLRDLANSDQWRVVGLLDDDTGKHGGAIQGVKILGALERGRCDCAGTGRGAGDHRHAGRDARRSASARWSFAARRGCR